MLPLLGGICLLSTAAMLLLYASMQRNLLSQFKDSLHTKAVALGSLVHVQPGGRLDFDYADTDFPEFRQSKRPEYFQISLEDGSVVQRSASLNGKNLALQGGDLNDALQPIALPDGRPGRVLTFTRRADFDEDDPESVANAKSHPTAPPILPMITVAVARDTHALDQTLSRLRLYLILTILLLTIGVAVMVPIIVRRGLRPLDAIAAHANSLNLESLDVAFPENNLPEELMPISRRLNELLDRLTASFAREARFSANAAHELRTPIAEIRAVAEVALQWPDLRHTQRALSDVVDVSQRMEGLIETLLKLAQARAGQIVSHAAPLDVLAIAGQTVDLLDPIVRARDLSVDMGNPSGSLAWADPVLGRALVSNLVSNAIYHARPLGDVSIVETVADGRVVLTILNDTSGFTAAELALAREPFWTGSASRSEQRQGLGLALASEYARFLKATFSIDLTNDAKFRAVVGFPLSTREASVTQRDIADVANASEAR